MKTPESDFARITDDMSVSPDAMRSIPAADVDAEPFGLIINSYTRADAIADETLVAVPEGIAREAGFLVPVAITRAAWTDSVEWGDADSDRQTPQDEEGRLWDVLHMSAFAARRYRRATFPVELYRVPRGGRARTARLVELTCRFHRGDSGEDVATISLPDED